MKIIKYKKCIAKQDNKTMEVFVSKEGCKAAHYQYTQNLSAKELRTVVNKYLTEMIDKA